MSFLISTLSFIVAIGVLVTVHEFGHFWVARRLGVRVLRFSVGFGHPLLVFRNGKFVRPSTLSATSDAADHALPEATEYVVAAIPLGGYVKMLDEHEGDVPEHQKHQAFNRKPLWVKAAIVAAGPVFNLVFAVLAYWAIYMVGVEGVKPVLGQVPTATLAAHAGFNENDLILRVGETEVYTWGGAAMEIVSDALRNEHLVIQVIDHQDRLQERVIDLRDFEGLYEGSQILERIGFRPWRPKLEPRIAQVVAGGAAERAGFREGDVVITADKKAIEDWVEWVSYVRERPGQMIEVQVKNNGVRRELSVQPDSIDTESGVIGRIGAGTEIPEGLYEGMRAVERYGPIKAIGVATRKVVNMSGLMLDVLWKMIIGKAPLESISGPITIAQYAGQSAQFGLVPFLGFLAVISISLGVLNLLPIPLLDGGHLFYYAIEAIKGGPLPEAVHIVGQRLGIAALLTLMILAFYNDISRLLG